MDTPARLKGVTLIVLILCGVLASPAARAASDRIVASYATPTNYPYGLAYADGTLYLGDYVTKTVYQIDPDNGSVMGSYVPTPAPNGYMYGLAYSSGYLWATAGSPARLYRMETTSGSVVSSYAVSGVSAGNGLAADADYIYLANNNYPDYYVYKYSISGGSVVSSWNGAKYPDGLTVINHVPTSQNVLLNLGNIDGWVQIYDLDGTLHEGEQFLIDAPCPETNYVGDLATKDDTHIFFASDYLKVLYELEINWGGQEEPAVEPVSFGRVKALFR
ncbi:MAG: hypothetical protein PVH29_01180 [Candidatus Zixiibacteriota bacterium]